MAIAAAMAATASMAITVATRRAPRGAGGDRLTVALFALAAFLTVLALLAIQLRAGSAAPTRPRIVLRRVYETRVVETRVGGTDGGSSVTQSVSSSGSAAAPASAASTRSS